MVRSHWGRTCTKIVIGNTESEPLVTNLCSWDSFCGIAAEQEDERGLAVGV